MSVDPSTRGRKTLSHLALARIMSHSRICTFYDVSIGAEWPRSMRRRPPKCRNPIRESERERGKRAAADNDSPIDIALSCVVCVVWDRHNTRRERERERERERGAALNKSDINLMVRCHCGPFPLPFLIPFTRRDTCSVRVDEWGHAEFEIWLTYIPNCSKIMKCTAML